MIKNESLARFAATEVMGWSADSAAARDFNPAEVPADMMQLWEKAHQDKVGITLRNDYEGWQGTYAGFSIVDSDSGPAALTEVVCLAFGWKGEEDAQVEQKQDQRQP